MDDQGTSNGRDGAGERRDRTGPVETSPAAGPDGAGAGDAPEYLQMALQAGPVAFSVSRVETGVIVEANDVYLEIVGYDREDVIGRSSLELEIWEDPGQRDRLMSVFEREGVVEKAEVRVRRRDGEIRHLVMSIQRLRTLGDEAHALAISVDVTERKVAEARERETRSLLHNVFYASPLPIAISRLRDGRIIDVNQAWSDLTGYPRQMARERTGAELGLWLGSGRRPDFVSLVQEREVVRDYELEMRTREGDVRTVLVSLQRIQNEGEPTLLSVLNDSTDRKAALQALQESEERFRMMADSAPVMIWLTDTTRAYTYFNKPWLDFTGRSHDDEVGYGWAESVHPDDVERCLDTYEASFARCEPFSAEYRLRRHDGTYRWVLDHGTPRYGPDGGFAGYIGSCIDITGHKQTEQKLREAKNHAESMAQLKATFLTNLTHEIRTPLTVILGFTSILRQGVMAEYQRFVHLIERSGRRLLLMLDSMLDLAQLEAGTLEIEKRPYNVADVVHSVMNTLRPLAEEKGLAFDVQLIDDHVYAKLDHAVLTRVLNNLIDNAVKFTESGTIRLVVAQDDAVIRLRIEDTGIGIDEQFMPQVFEPFSQESTGLERTHQGSGLGLSVSKRLMELMGGDIEVESRKGRGSIFTIILPAAA